jgi:protein-S-isoprenylcysteine O-methyltransferase Ste14
MIEDSGTMTRCGIGPKFFTIAVLYAIPVGWLSYRYPAQFSIDCVPYWAIVCVAVGSLAVGTAIYVRALRTFNRCYRQGCLAREGAFSLVRHPIYAAWIWLIIPGCVLLFRSWLLLTVPLVAYVSFRVFIREEDDYLHRKFGQSYLKYRSQTREMFPF